MIVVWGLLYTLLGLIALVLLMPLHLDARGVLSDERIHGRARVRWGLWLLMLRAQASDGITLRLLGIRVWRKQPLTAEKRAERKAKKAEKRAAKQKKRAKKPKRKRPFWQRFGRGPSLRDGLYTLKTGWRLLPLHGRIHGALGLSDPSDTGAVFTALDPVARRSRTIELDIEPVWIDAEVDLHGWVQLRLWPIELIIKLLWHLIWDARIRRTVWAVVRRG
jgi:hypothetical protein